MNQSPLLTVKEVAALLGMSAVWCYQHSSGRRRPHLPSVKLGGAVRFERGQVEEFIRQQRREALVGVLKMQHPGLSDLEFAAFLRKEFSVLETEALLAKARGEI